MTTPAANALPDEPGELSPQELKIFVAHLLGWPQWRIAMHVGLTEQRVAQVIGSPRFKAAVAVAQKKVLDASASIMTRLAELAPKALERVAYLMENSKAENVQMRSAFDILDRAGFKPVERSEVTKTYNINPEDAALLQETLHQRRAIEAEFTRVPDESGGQAAAQRPSTSWPGDL